MTYTCIQNECPQDLHLISPAFCFQAMVANPKADVAPENLVVRFSEAVDGFPLPKGHSANPDLKAEQKPEGEAFLKDRS